MLPFHPGKCARMHGHSYRLEVAVRGPIEARGPARGMIEDFDRIERMVQRSRRRRCSTTRHLNDFIENPTVENIVLWIWKRLDGALPRSTNSSSGKPRPPAPSCAARIIARHRERPLHLSESKRCIAVLQLSEIFYSIQGEGSWTGTPAVFVRLAGCNLACDFCDTDYSTKFFAGVDEVVAMVRGAGGDCPMVVLTGGEPLAQAETPALIEALRGDGRRVHVESNGTIFSPICPTTFGSASRRKNASIRAWRRARTKRS